MRIGSINYGEPNSGSPGMIYLCLVSVVILAFIFVALDGHMYWHEARLLYGVTHFKVSELLAGQFNPNQLGGDINTAGSAGYHLTKVLYLQSLDCLTRLPLTPDQQLMVGSFVSLLVVVTCGFLARIILRNLGASPALVNWSALAFFLMPATPYLAGKLLSEVTAMLPAFIALSLWSRCLAAPRPSNWTRALGASVMIAITALMRLDMIIVHVSFALATLVTSTASSRRRLFQLHFAILACASVLYVLYLASHAGAFPSILEYLRQYLLLDPKSWLMSAFGLATFAGLMWIFALAGMASFNRLTALLTIWLLAALIPIVIVVANYMIEPRYLVSASLPLAGLAGAGFLRVIARFPGDRAQRFVFIIPLLAFINWLAVPLMPYEVDRSAILRAADKYSPSGSDSYLLVPWSYTDYHFLRYARPGSKIYNVNTPPGMPDPTSAEWTTRLLDWYGDRYLPDAEALSAIDPRGPVYYLGWGAYPPIETLRSWADKVPIEPLRGRLQSLQFMAHRDQSWLWSEPDIRFQLLERFGQYEIYEVSVAGRQTKP